MIRQSRCLDHLEQRQAVHPNVGQVNKWDIVYYSIEMTAYEERHKIRLAIRSQPKPEQH